HWNHQQPSVPEGKYKRLPFGAQAVGPFGTLYAPAGGQINEADIPMDDPARHPAQSSIAQKPPAEGDWPGKFRHALLDRGGGLLGKLHRINAGIKPAPGQQLGMPAGLDDLPAIDGAIQVRPLDRRQPMRNAEWRA